MFSGEPEKQSGKLLFMWTVLSKKIDRKEAGSVEMVVIVERGGRWRRAVISGATWDGLKAGDPLDLCDGIDHKPEDFAG